MSSNAMHVAKTGLNAQQSRIQVISNNLANVNTMGFKRDRVNFESQLYQVYRPAGAQTSEATNATSASAIGTGVRMVSTEKLYSQGSLMNTENNLDVAIPRCRRKSGTLSRECCPDGLFAFSLALTELAPLYKLQPAG